MAVSAFGRALSYTGSVLAIETAGHVPCATARLDLRQAHCVEQCLPWLQATSLAAGFARQLCPKWQRTNPGPASNLPGSLPLGTLLRVPPRGACATTEPGRAVERARARLQYEAGVSRPSEVNAMQT